MCCRYWTDESPELRAFVEEMNRSPLLTRWPRTSVIAQAGEVRPGEIAAVIAPDRQGKRAVFPMKWGFSGRTLLMNARSETASEKPTFRDAWASHRCIVPAAGYYEWEHIRDNGGKKKSGDRYAIRPKEGAMTCLCGLYRIEAGLPVFVILTREAGEGIRFIHERMPLILPERLIDDWIRPQGDPEKLLPFALTDMKYEINAG